MPWSLGIATYPVLPTSGAGTPGTLSSRLLVFLELMRREGDVYVGQSSGGEIDLTVAERARRASVLPGQRIGARLGDAGSGAVLAARRA